jgi:hypothetical protein
MLSFLYAAERNESHYSVTGDESWFFFNASIGQMLTLSRDYMATKSRLDIQSKKFVCTIIWNPSGFYVVNRLLNDVKMNSAYFVTDMHTPLE